ncbi:MAG: hypothetical protein GDA44_03640 [Prochloron sp. SP5CPC1]|nr:hypothetical protein [Candidatus Paraprochloron terpiosi SP5CPC1]
MSEKIILQARLREDGMVVQVLPDGSEVILSSQTDWERVDTMTDEEIEAAALSDPDCPPNPVGWFRRKSLQGARKFSG